jgi:H+/gluconate symporter-like permease
MSIVFLLVSLAILMVLCLRGIPIFIATFAAGTVLIVTAGMSPVSLMVQTYAPGIGKYFGSFFFIFVFGALFGKLTDISGAAESIATFIIKKLGEKYVIPAIFIACAVLTYGGVSVFVALFTLYSMMVSLFRKANLPRRLIPLVYFAGAGTFTITAPGSPQIQNLIPMKYLGTTATAGLVPGLIAGGVEFVLIIAYLYWAVKRSRAKGEGWVERSSDIGVTAGANRKLPNVIIAILPMAALLIALNVFKLASEASLFIGIVAAVILYAKFIDWKNIWKNLSVGTVEGTTSLFNTAATVGFGYLIQAVPAFKIAIHAVTSTGLNPLIGAGLAVGTLVFISGSGSGAQSILLPILAGIYLPRGVDPQALHRVVSFAGQATTPPFNGLIVTVLTVCGLTHKEAYFPIFISTLIIPLIGMIVLFNLYMFLF